MLSQIKHAFLQYPGKCLVYHYYEALKRLKLNFGNQNLPSFSVSNKHAEMKQVHSNNPVITQHHSDTHNCKLSSLFRGVY